MNNRYRNATSSIRGWDFQENAAIFLMVEHIKDAVSIRVEGATEDIEIAFKDKSRLYAQAKSSRDPDSTKNVLVALDKALSALEDDSKKNDCRRIVYICNFDDPFNEPTTLRYFGRYPSLIPYKDLPPVCRSHIDTLCTRKHCSNFCKDNFVVCSIPFRGDAPGRYRVIKEKVQNLLNTLSVSNRISCDDVLSRWQLDFHQNASQTNLFCEISKEQLIWPIIAWLCRLDADSEELAGYDTCQQEAIIVGYGGVICDKVDNFQFVSRVMAAFFQFQQKHSTERKMLALTSNFIETEWQQFSKEFIVSEDVDLKDVVQITMRKVLGSRSVIRRIKEGVSL